MFLSKCQSFPFTKSLSFTESWLKGGGSQIILMGLVSLTCSNLEIFNLHANLYAYLYCIDFEKEPYPQPLGKDSFSSIIAHKTEYFREIEYTHLSSIRGFREDKLLLTIIKLHSHTNTHWIIG